MTRTRVFGSDVPFCDWMRTRKDLPSASRSVGFVASDVDLFLHRYMTAVDNIGTREVQSMGALEVKTRGGGLHQSQSDTLSKINLMSRGQQTIDDMVVRHYGVSILFLSGECPDNSRTIEWGRFQKDNTVRRHRITVVQLVSLLRFDLHWHNLAKNAFRRHHKTTEIIGIDRAPLGFEVETVVKVRS